MSDLIERYVHQVGLYVRPKERTEIEAELRSQIQDQIEDRCGDQPTREEVAAVLKQLGDPRTMAASYGGEQYLVGPQLYPFLLTVLRFGLPLSRRGAGPRRAPAAGRRCPPGWAALGLP